EVPRRRRHRPQDGRVPGEGARPGQAHSADQPVGDPAAVRCNPHSGRERDGSVMPKARLELDVGSRGASLRAISRDLRRMDAQKVTGIFKKALERAADPYPRRVRAAALAVPVKEGGKHTGLRARIAGCVTETSWANSREAGVSVWIDTRKMEPDYRTLPLYMDGAAGARGRGYRRGGGPGGGGGGGPGGHRAPRPALSRGG